MSISNRFLPSHPAGEVCLFFLDFSNILPPGVGIASATVAVERNSVPPTPTTDFTIGPVTINGRRVYVQLSGGVTATDYRIRFTPTDTIGNVWPRTTLLLCSETS